jgi:hypothetical protein
MNCKRVEELIPLYAGGDTGPRETGEVRLHLSGCTSCAALAAEYETSRAWLSAAPGELPGELDEALIADMKRGVMRELQEPDSRPFLFEVIRSAFAGLASQPAVAVALLLIVFGVLTLWLYRAKPTAPEQARVTSGSRDSSGSNVEPPTKAHEKVKPTHLGKNAIAGSNHNNSPNTRRAVVAQRTVVQDTKRTGETHTPLAAAVQTSGMLRIDIQTDDPSIRIIWFAPKDADSPQANLE